MNDWRRHWWKPVTILALWLLASHWDYQDTQRMQQERNWARVAKK